VNREEIKQAEELIDRPITPENVNDEIEAFFPEPKTKESPSPVAISDATGFA